MIQEVFIVSNYSDATQCLDHYSTALNLKCRSMESADELFFSIRQNKPHLVIIDFILNDINGGTICHQIKCDPVFHDLPVALLTEYNSLENIAPKFGCEYLLVKPLTFDCFSSLVEKAGKMELQKL